MVVNEFVDTKISLASQDLKKYLVERQLTPKQIISLQYRQLKRGKMAMLPVTDEK